MYYSSQYTSCAIDVRKCKLLCKHIYHKLNSTVNSLMLFCSIYHTYSQRLLEMLEIDLVLFRSLHDKCFTDALILTKRSITKVVRFLHSYFGISSDDLQPFLVSNK